MQRRQSGEKGMSRVLERDEREVEDHPVRMLLRRQPCVAYYHLLLYCRWHAIKAAQRGREEGRGEGSTFSEREEDVAVGSSRL